MIPAGHMAHLSHIVAAVAVEETDQGFHLKVQRGGEEADVDAATSAAPLAPDKSCQDASRE